MKQDLLNFSVLEAKDKKVEKENRSLSTVKRKNGSLPTPKKNPKY